jgi:hypothetical protein
MKSMSIVDHGSDRCACVCRCSSGFCSASSPLIHILAGENVCIQAMTPRHASSAFAAIMVARMPAESVRTGRQTMRTGMPSAASSCATTSWDCAATWASVSSP